MPRGGRRPGAGRKLAPEVEEFRQWLRGKFNSPEGRKAIARRIWASDVLLAKALSLAFPAPHEVDVTFNRIPPDFVFDCELSERGAPAAAAPLAVSASRRGESSD